MRNYDENLIIINDYGALFLAGWHIILFALGIFIIVFSDTTLLFSHLYDCAVGLLLFSLHNTYVFSPRVFKQKPSFLDFLASKFII